MKQQIVGYNWIFTLKPKAKAIRVLTAFLNANTQNQFFLEYTSPW